MRPARALMHIWCPPDGLCAVCVRVNDSGLGFRGVWAVEYYFQDPFKLSEKESQQMPREVSLL